MAKALLDIAANRGGMWRAKMATLTEHRGRCDIIGPNDVSRTRTHVAR